MMKIFTKKKNKNESLTENYSCFIVACHGWSGSHWFSHALNLHKDVICTHSASNLLSDSIEMHSNENLKSRSRERYENIKQKIKYSESLDSYYNRIIETGKAKFYGSVHLFQLKDINALRRKFNFKRNYIIINQVRNPISFIWSGYGQLKDLFKIDVWVLKGTLDLIFHHAEDFLFHIGEKYNVDICDLDNIAFFGASCNLMNLGMDVESGKDVLFVPMEKLTSEPEYFKEIFEFLMDKRVVADDNYLNEVFEIGELNKHRHDKKIITPKERFETLSDWQKETVKYFVEKSGIREKYSSIGYDFSYL